MAEREEQTRARPRRWLPVWAYPIAAAFSWAIAIGVVLYFLPAIKIVALGFLAATAVAAMLHPLAERLPARRIVSGAVVGIGFLILVAGLVTLLFWLLTDTIQQEISQWPQIRAKLNELLAQWGRRLGIDQPMTLGDLLRQAETFLVGPSGPDILNQTANAVTNFLIGLAFVFIGSIYLLAERPGTLLDPVLRMLPEHRRPQLKGAMDDLEPQLRWWLLGTIISMTIIGTTSWIGYMIVGLNFAVPLALLMGFAEIIPTVGPIAAFLVAILFAATQGTGVMLGVFVVYVVTQLLESYVVLPLVMERVVRIPPVVTLFTVVLWGKALGPAGLLLALPIDLLVFAIASHFLMQPPEKDMRREGG